MEDKGNNYISDEDKGTYAILAGKNEDIEEYSSIFDGKNGIIIRKESGGGWLLSNETICQVKSSSDAKSMAIDLLDVLHGIMTTLVGGPYLINVDGMRIYDEEKCETQISKGIQGLCYMVKPIGEDVPLKAEKLIKGLFDENNGYSKILTRCLLLLRNGLPNLYDGYKIYELIRDDMKEYYGCKSGEKALEKANILPEDELKCMTCNMNNYSLQGNNSRHAVDQSKHIPLEKYSASYRDVQDSIMKMFANWVKIRSK